MKININPKNEYVFVPEFSGNKTFPEEQQMKVTFKRINRLALQTNAVTQDGKFSIIDYTKSLIVRIENPFTISNGEKDRAMTIDDVFKFPELEELSAELFNAANKIQNEGGLEPKNS